MNKEPLEIFKKDNPTLKIDVGPHLRKKFEKLMRSKAFYIYSENEEDNVCKGWYWNLYGAYETNFLWMTVEDSESKNVYVGFVESPLVYPPMIERKFGMDVADVTICGALSNVIGDVYAEELI
jgi:hypothetical protein